jgi:hypothetical protein
MLRLLIEQSAASVDNRRERKRRATEKEQQQERINNQQSVHTPCVSRSPFDSKAILAKTLQYLNANSLEKERQKNAQMMIRNVRDKLTLRRCNKDSIGQELDNLS